MVRRRQRRRNAAIGIVIVMALAIGAGLLTVLALQSVEPKPTERSPEPDPTFSFGEPEVTATPSTEAEPAAFDAPARSEQRILAVGDEPGVMWRAIEGSCADGIPPLIERSADNGSTWTDVTPLYRDVRQVLTLEPFAGNQAQAMVAQGVDCAIEGLRTFTQGQFWEPYSEVLDQSNFVSLDATLVVTPDGELAAPCAEPRNVRAMGGTVRLLCDGDMYTWSDETWKASGHSGLLALSSASSALPLAAWVSSECDGPSIGFVSDPPLTASECLTISDLSEGFAMAVSSDEVWIWSGNAVRAVNLPPS